MKEISATMEKDLSICIIRYTYEQRMLRSTVMILKARDAIGNIRNTVCNLLN